MSTKKTEKSPLRVGLYVYVERQRYNGLEGYIHVNAYPVLIGMNTWEMREIDENVTDRRHVDPQRITNFSDRETVNGLSFDGLKVTSQGHDSDEQRHLYAWEIGYKDKSVTVDNVKGIAHTLTTIDRRLEHYTEKFGRPSTFGQYIGRIANAIGAESIVTTVDRKNSSSYSEQKHRFSTIADGVAWVDYLVKKWAAKEELPVV